MKPGDMLLCRPSRGDHPESISLGTMNGTSPGSPACRPSSRKTIDTRQEPSFEDQSPSEPEGLTLAQ